MPPSQMLPLAGLQVQAGIHDQTEPQAIFHDWAGCWLSSTAEWGHWPGSLVRCGQRLQLLFSIIIFCGSHIWLFLPFWLAIFNKILSVRHTFKMCEYSYLHIYTQTHIYTYTHVYLFYPIILIHAVFRSLILLFVVSSDRITYVAFFLCGSTIFDCTCMFLSTFPSCRKAWKLKIYICFCQAPQPSTATKPVSS